MAGMRILVLDAGAADLAYGSESKEIVLCSNERYHLELHEFLTIAPAHRYVKETWEDYFNHGQNWAARGKFLATFNSLYRPKTLRSWNDLSQYYCILCMSGFNVTYDRWRLVGEHFPVTPDYAAIREWHGRNKERQIRYYRRNIYNFPTQEVDSNTVIYIHLPTQFASYGYGYVWTRRKFERMVHDFTELAELGYKIVISSVYERWGRRVTNYSDAFSPDIFTAHRYTELKAQKPGFSPQPLTEEYLVANLG